MCPPIQTANGEPRKIKAINKYLDISSAPINGAESNLKIICVTGVTTRSNRIKDVTICSMKRILFKIAMISYPFNVFGECGRRLFLTPPTVFSQKLIFPLHRYA